MNHLKTILLFLGAALSTSLSAFETPRDPHPDTLRVITYNTWYVFNHQKEIDAGKHWLKNQTPDIVALQELTNIKPALLQSFAESWDHPHSALLKSSGFSVGLTSRYPITTVEKGRENMHHGFLHARTATIDIFVVHLSPFKWKVRQREADILIRKIKPLLAAGKKVIVLGDFNALSPADAKILAQNNELLKKSQASDAKHAHVQNLRNNHFEFGVMKSFLDAGLSDTAQNNLPLTPSERTSCPTGVFTETKATPTNGQRIDYILTGPILSKKIARTTIPKNEATNRISDHYPVTTDFNFQVK